MAGMLEQLQERPGAPDERGLAYRAAEATLLVAWLCYLLDELTIAEKHYDAAAALARLSGDQYLRARELVERSRLEPTSAGGQTVRQRAHVRAMKLLRQAAQLADWRAPSRLMALLHERLAEEYALAGQHEDAQRHLERAGLFVGFESDAGEFLPETWDQTWLSYYRGTCARLAGQLDLAAEHLQQALATATPDFPYDRCTILTELGVTYAQKGEVEAATALMSEAFEIAVGRGQRRCERRIMRFRREFLPPRGNPLVKEFDGQLTARRRELNQAQRPPMAEAEAGGDG